MTKCLLNSDVLINNSPLFWMAEFSFKQQRFSPGLITLEGQTAGFWLRFRIRLWIKFWFKELWYPVNAEREYRKGLNYLTVKHIKSNMESHLSSFCKFH